MAEVSKPLTKGLDGCRHAAGHQTEKENVCAGLPAHQDRQRRKRTTTQMLLRAWESPVSHRAGTRCHPPLTGNRRESQKMALRGKQEKEVNLY